MPSLWHRAITEGNAFGQCDFAPWFWEVVLIKIQTSNMRMLQELHGKIELKKIYSGGKTL